MIALLLFGSMALFLALGVPIAFSLGLSTLIGFNYIGVPLTGLSQRIFTATDSFSIMAIPFFVLAGNIMTKGGISKRLVSFTNSIIGNIRGGMSIVSVISCAFFAALSGSGPATVIAIGAMLYPEMVKLDYPKARSAGLIAVAGGLGPIIPPSIIMVVYATITDASIAKLFTAGAFWGIIITTALSIVCIYLAKRENWPKNNKKVEFVEFKKNFISAFPAMLLPFIILGGIYSGKFTPTESAGIAVVYAMIVSLYVYKEISYKDLYNIIIESAKGSSMVLFIIATSTAFAWLFTYSGISGNLVKLIMGLSLSKNLLLLLISFILLVFGIFLEGIATVVLLIPVLFPIVKQLGVDPVHFGMIVTVANVIGCMTPPVAVNIFSAASISKLSIEEIAKGEIPFFITLIAIFFIIVLIPYFTLMLI
ncbi:TRAP transporter large permease [Cetobacterium sp. 8H]|uniref:TRAP transporter large permease n=1 Tax=Cetobacterium sp. 8H TaxID=2759681 RepID=UPI00163C65C6|nr:TRAP transporter large permease [Cetobacterium sp. 8H]MBC2849890.1 TRAP transporter large permease [Cetobacterium sp. 8H]